MAVINYLVDVYNNIGPDLFLEYLPCTKGTFIRDKPIVRSIFVIINNICICLSPDVVITYVLCYMDYSLFIPHVWIYIDMRKNNKTP